MLKMNTPGGALKCGMWFLVPRGRGYHLIQFTSSPFFVAMWSNACAAAYCPLIWPTGKIDSSGAIWKGEKMVFSTLSH